MIRTVARFAAVASASVALLALAPAAAPAKAPSASVQFVNQARLQPDGTVLVTLVYQCNPSSSGTEGFIAVRLEQPPQEPETTGAYGQAFVPANCNDQKHRVTLDVAPGPFSPGSATAQAVVSNIPRTSSAEKFAELKVR